jgi:hypothetical protein
MAKYYRKYISEDSEDYDWITLTEEIRGCPDEKYSYLNHPTSVWEVLLKERLQHLRDWLDEKRGYEKNHPYLINNEIADIIVKYQQKGEIEFDTPIEEKKEIGFAPPPEGYKTVDMEDMKKKIPKSSTVDEKEWAEAHGYEYSSDEDEADDDEEWYESAKRFANKE